jgi:hypothetical protein
MPIFIKLLMLMLMKNKYLLSFFSCLLFLLVSCKNEESTKPIQYEIQPYEVGADYLFVQDSVNGLFPTPMTSSFEGIGLQFKENQFPEYLSQSVFRSFAFLSETDIEVTIRPRNTNLIERTQSTLLEDGTLTSLPDFFYDETEDYFYQCFAVIQGKPGPEQNMGIFYRTFATSCGDMNPETLANQHVSSIGHLDTLLVSFIHLPFRKM